MPASTPDRPEPTPPIPATMTAVAVAGGRGGPEALHAVQVPTPRPGPGELLIRVEAAGVNRPDLLQRRGLYPPPAGAPDTLGLEAAGLVAAVGEGVDAARMGERVAALLGGGGYAAFVAVDARHALPIPGGLTTVEAAALPETIFTVWANVFDIAGLKAGETFMVHAATSGIGQAAIQMAKAAGARVIATGRGPGKKAAALSLGADVGVDTTAEDFAKAAEDEGGVDVILDMVGGDYTAKNLHALRFGGRLVQIAFLSSPTAAVDLNRVMRQRLTLTGSTLRNRPADDKARLTRAIRTTVWPWIAAGKLKPVIDRTFPLAQAGDAHAWLERGEHVGKVVLTA